MKANENLYISPQNLLIRFMYSELISKNFVCHVLENQQTNTTKLLQAHVKEANLSTLNFFV